MAKKATNGAAAALPTPPEARIALAAASGEIADVGGNDVRASFLRALLLGLPLSRDEHGAIKAHCPAYERYPPDAVFAPVPIAPPGVRLRNAVVRGKLDLSHCTGVGGTGLPALALVDCRLEGDGRPNASEPGQDGWDVMTCLNLSDARIAGLSLKGSRLSHLSARETQIDGPLDLSDVRPLADWTTQPWPSVSPDDHRQWMRRKAKWVKESIDAAIDAIRFDERSPSEPTPPDPAQLRPWPDTVLDHCWIELGGTRIDGQLSLERALLRAPPPRPEASIPFGWKRYALCLISTDILGGVFAINGAQFEGGVRMSAAHVHGDVWFTDTRLLRGEGSAFNAQATVFDGILALDGSLASYGEMWLMGCRLRGALLMKGAAIDGAGDAAVVASAAEIGGDIFMNKGFSARGEVDLIGARLSGSLYANLAFLHRSKPDQRHLLVANGLVAGGNIMLNDLIAIEGGIGLGGARVSGWLALQNAVIDGHAVALAAETLKIDDDVSIVGGGFRGLITFQAARIGGLFLIGGTSCDGGGGVAIMANDLTADRSVTLHANLGVRGQVSMQGATIQSDLKIERVNFRAGDATALLARGTEIGGAFIANRNTIEGGVVLTDASCATFDDNPSSFQGAASLHLDGFKYGTLSNPGCGDDLNIRASRGRWLDLQPNFKAQPYVQLSRVLHAQGEDDAARDILLCKIDRQREDQRRRRRERSAQLRLSPGQAILNLPRTMLAWIIDAARGLFSLLFGYGLKPGRAILTLLVAALSGWAFFSVVNARGAMIIDQQPVASVVAAGRLGAVIGDSPPADAIACGEAIRPSLYALDVFIPLIDLRQETECEIGAAANRGDGLFQGFPTLVKDLNIFVELEVYRYMKALYAIAGWLIISLSILTFSGVLQRRGEED